MLAALTSRQVAEWRAYAGLRGLPELQADFRAGQICAMQANVHLKEGAKPFSSADFMPALREEPEPEAEPAAQIVDIEAHSRAIAALLGKKE